MRVILYFSFMWGVFLICRQFVRALDQKACLSWSGGRAAAVGIFLAAGAAVSCGEADMAGGILKSFLFAYLAFCAYCDYETKEVYRFLQYPALLAGGFYLLLAGGGVESVIGLGCYALLQLILLRRFYGWADTLAFLVCGLYITGGRPAGMSGAGGVVLGGAVHVGLSLLFMIIRQAFRKNMDWKRGRLKQPAPFLPAIALAMLSLMAARLCV